MNAVRHLYVTNSNIINARQQDFIYVCNLVIKFRVRYEEIIESGLREMSELLTFFCHLPYSNQTK